MNDHTAALKILQIFSSMYVPTEQTTNDMALKFFQDYLFFKSEPFWRIIKSV